MAAFQPQRSSMSLGGNGAETADDELLAAAVSGNLLGVRRALQAGAALDGTNATELHETLQDALAQPLAALLGPDGVEYAAFFGINTSTPLTLLQQRIEVVLSAPSIRVAFAGWQFGAMVPGGCETLAAAAAAAPSTHGETASAT